MNRPRRDKGFTFLEVLIALAILAIAGVGVVSMVNNSMRTMGDANVMVQATLLAQEQLFELQRDGVNAITDRRGQFDDHPGFAWKARAYSTDISGLYRLRVAVTDKRGTKEYAIVEAAFLER